MTIVASGCAPPPGVAAVEQATTTGLVQVTGFGNDYDHINMWKYVPAGMPANAPLVLALHPCGYTAPLDDFAAKIGWNALADKYKFYVVYPEQIAANNSLYCFNWAGDNTASDGTNQPNNLIRGMGENQEIINMVKKMETDYSIDPSRVFITGFSGGGAQTALMLAVWPDVFAAGASLEGVAYHCTLNKNEVSSPCMNPGKDLTAQQWGDFVRMALPSGYAGPWPRLQIWEGSSDTFVGVDNVNELVKQWTNVLGIAATPISDKVQGNDHAVYKDGAGNVAIESYMISGMSHAVALDPTKGCGTADGNYYVDKGICSTELVAEFFGLQNPPNVGGGSDGGGIGDGGGAGGGGGGGAGGGGGSGGAGGGGGGNWITPGSGGSTPPTACHGCSAAGGGASDAVWAIAVVAVMMQRRRKRNGLA
ncbi:MAG TPA: PHB depolymerase family esterase [Polyangia bacterium]|nr:PHB depolymerase family esterase [Polyangia bacterium]